MRLWAPVGVDCKSCNNVIIVLKHNCALLKCQLERVQKVLHLIKKLSVESKFFSPQKELPNVLPPTLFFFPQNTFFLRNIVVHNISLLPDLTRSQSFIRPIPMFNIVSSGAIPAGFDWVGKHRYIHKKALLERENRITAQSLSTDSTKGCHLIPGMYQKEMKMFSFIKEVMSFSLALIGNN